MKSIKEIRKIRDKHLDDINSGRISLPDREVAIFFLTTLSTMVLEMEMETNGG